MSVSIKSPEERLGHVKYICDFELCDGMQELREALASINRHQYRLVSVTQVLDLYTVFFERPAYG